MDYQNELLGNYYDLLNGQIIIEGSEIEVGTKISNDQGDFVTYDVVFDDDRGTFDTVIREIDVNVQCISIQAKHLGDDSKVNSMVNQVKEIIKEDSFSMANWIIELFLDKGTVPANSEDDDHYTYRRTITFKHFIRKL